MDITLILNDLVFTWINLFIDTLTNLQIIWITYPVYITWLAMEIFEERNNKISYGHAATNGVIAIWISIDWFRHILLNEENYTINLNLSIIDIYKLIVTTINFIIGMIILRSAFKKSKIAKFIGKIRVISYFQIFFSPIIYGVVNFDFISVISILLFFPVVYFIFELLDRLLPDIIKEEEEDNYSIYSDSNYLSSSYDNNTDYNSTNNSNNTSNYNNYNNNQSSYNNTNRNINYYSYNRYNNNYNYYSNYNNYYNDNYYNQYRNRYRRS